MKPILYSYYRSSCSYRVRIALALKNIDYEYAQINLVKDGGQQFMPNYQALNPQGLVPTLVVNDHVLSQSIAILEYLEEAYQDAPRILPKDLYQRGKVRSLVQFICSDIQPIQNMRVLKYVGNTHPDWAKHWVETGFNALEKELVKCSGKFCVGDDISMADIVLVPQVYNAKRFNIDMHKYPKISELDDKLTDLPAFQAAHPSKQPDCPKDN
ncbi:unnamed protein product [Gordionus sp. m RMFG-2023]